MIKKFIYHFKESDYKGYRLIIEKGYFNSFKKLILEGFKIEYSSTYTIAFNIDVKLLRRLKLLELNGNKSSRAEQTLALLISRSKEEDFDNNMEFYPYGHYWYDIETTTTSDIQEAKYFKKEQKNRVNNHSKIYNQKFKQYRR